jgi:stage V sporulation protein G
MEITDVKVIPVDDEKLKAFVSIVFDQSFVVTDIKIINGPKGLFVSMPSKKRKDGTFKDIAHPLNNQMRQYLEDKVLTVYRQQLASAPGAGPGSSAGREAAGRPMENPPPGAGRPGSGEGSEGNGGTSGEVPRS